MTLVLVEARRRVVPRAGSGVARAANSALAGSACAKLDPAIAAVLVGGQAMKLFYPALALGLTVLASTRGAQAAPPRQIEITGTAGYRFGGSLDVGLDDENDDVDDGVDEHGTVSFDSSASYGGILGIRVPRSGGVGFLSYSRQETTVRFKRFDGDGASGSEGSASIEYFQIGGNLEITRGRLTPYFGLSLGMTRFAGLDSDTGDRFFFSGALDGGLKIELTPFLYLRVLGRMPVTFPTGEMYCFSGRGCIVSLHGQALVQGEFQGGLTLAL